jgi:DNA-binding GntR family transcriptional regulator
LPVANDSRAAKPTGETLEDDGLVAIWHRQARELGVADAVYATLRQAIVSGVMQPGTHLREEGLARRFSVSRTPVREAVLRLGAERLAERTRRGVVVPRVTPDEILELYVVRENVDGLGARLAAEEARPSDVARLHWLNDKLRRLLAGADSQAMARVSLEFHEEIYRCARNVVLLELTRPIHDRVRRIPGTTFSDPARARAAVAEHDQIVEAIEQRLSERAEMLARQHMAGAMTVRIAMLRSQPRGG